MGYNMVSPRGSGHDTVIMELGGLENQSRAGVGGGTMGLGEILGLRRHVSHTHLACVYTLMHNTIHTHTHSAGLPPHNEHPSCQVHQLYV